MANIIDIFAEKSGLSDKVGVVSRSQELLRLIRSQGSLGGLGASETAIIAISLHLAAEESESCPSASLATLQKLSGIKSKTQYASLKETIATQLGVSKALSIEEICVKLGCTQVRQKALELMSAYAKSKPEGHGINMNAPVFSCAAVASACKLAKVSIDKNDLLSISRAKRAHLSKLSMEFDEIGKTKSSKKTSQPKNDLAQNIFSKSVDSEGNENIDVPKKSILQINRRKTEEDENEEFEQWCLEMYRRAGVL